jgi:hypothetical protein
MTRWLVIVMGVVLALAGFFAMAIGAEIVDIERGWTEVIAGATLLGSGVVTISIGLLIGALQSALAAGRGLAAESVRQETASPALDADPAAAAHSSVGAGIDQTASPTRENDDTDAAKELEGDRSRGGEPGSVVGEYRIGGTTYVLYDNGDIVGDTDEGPVRFKSLAELRAHVDRVGPSGAEGY